MKKVGLAILILGVSVGLAACGSNGEKTEKTTEATEQSTEGTTTKEDKKMEAMEEDLDEKGIEITSNSDGSYLWFTREKSVDYDYFVIQFIFKSNPNEIFEVKLELKGNIDGKLKDPLYYDVSKGRIVESSGSDTNINTLAEVLESIDYSDKELLEFAQWYHDKEK